MLKVFLVEDEIVMREGIKNKLSWEENGFEFVGDASDGELAYSMIQKCRPDIIITDIKMPFMDGLELSRLIKKDMPWIKIILLSGYDEFEYAQKAISIGVTEYLLKPISGSKLMDAIQKVASVIQEEKCLQENIERFQREMLENEHNEISKLFNDLVSKKLPVSELFEKARRLNMDLGAGYYNILLYKVFINQEETEEYSEESVDAKKKIEDLIHSRNDILMFDRATEGWAFLIKANDEVEEVSVREACLSEFERIIKEYGGLEYFAGVGMPVNRLRELSRSFQEANKAFAYRHFAEQKNKVARYDKLEEYLVTQEHDIDIRSMDTTKMDKKIIESFLKNGTEKEIVPFLEEFFMNLGEDNVESLLFRQYIVLDSYFTIVRFVEDLGYRAEDINSEGATIREINSLIVSVSSSKRYLEDLFLEVFRLREKVSMKRYTVLLARAKDYIMEHYNREEISLNNVAASVNISPSHFSTIFSQETGQTFIEYLTTVRMEKAKELLRCSGMKSSEIGYAVGYKDPHYFSYLFKKTQECTPREYRANGK